MDKVNIFTYFFSDYYTLNIYDASHKSILTPLKN